MELNGPSRRISIDKKLQENLVAVVAWLVRSRPNATRSRRLARHTSNFNGRAWQPLDDVVADAAAERGLLYVNGVTSFVEAVVFGRSFKERHLNSGWENAKPARDGRADASADCSPTSHGIMGFASPARDQAG